MPEGVTYKPRAESPVRYVEADIIGYSTKSGPREGHEGSQTTTVTEHTAISVNNVNTMRAYLKLFRSDHQKPEASSATRRARHRRICSHLTDIAENLIYDAAAPAS
ncbi:hypothetical protein EVAR_59779_1 [Eumeta japonica]|uniref:Uncharacterized protein n=1 Tax=Eumeta variegata TaxID=151549 RepID=A0A4C1ZI65_EUMVA|nr:hypothetical protein EVAR_59779_1 [Eumeta japonica]